MMLRESNKEKFIAAMQDYDLSEVVVTSSEFTSFRGNLSLFEFEKKENPDGDKKNIGDTLSPRG